MTTTVAQEFAGPDRAYWGDQGDWLILAGKHRDSDALSRANFDAAIELARDRGVKCETMTAGHWLVGHVSYVIVPPTDAARALAEYIAEQLADYPVLDDDRLCEYEYAEIIESLADFVRFGHHRSDFRDRADAPDWPDPDALAPYLYDALVSRNGDATPYLERWPNLERGQPDWCDERVLVADALRAYRRDHRAS